MPAPVPREDVREGNRAGATVHRSEWQFRRLLEKLPAGAYTCNAEGLITYFNHHAEKLWGRAPRLSDPVDRFCGSFKLHTADGSPLTHDQCWMALALQTGKEYNGEEIIIERPDGQRLTVLAHANPICDEQGKLLGAVNVLVDISDRKRAENELKDADRSKNEFLATLAHELRNPLAPISNAVRILQLRSQGLPDPQWALEVIDRQMAQLTRLIDDLLDLARVTSNKLDLRERRIELAEVLQAAVETSRPMIEASGQEFVVTFPPEPICIYGDLTRLAQVVSNLLNNAAKYTGREGHIRLRAEREGGEAVIVVRDTGIGIPAEVLPRVFEMFMQADRSLDRSQGGLGIGLSVAKRLVDLHGGTITARSDGPGSGSEFVVRLPIAAEPSQALNQTNREIRRPRVAHSLRVLVVDDNRDSAESLGMLLEMVGHDIRTAHDGLEAVEMADRFRPDVVLLDLGLPNMNGFDAARRIRQEAWGKRMVLIAVTGWGQEADRQRSREVGFDDHLVKPVDTASLFQWLEQTALKRRGVAEEPAKRQDVAQRQRQARSRGAKPVRPSRR